MGEFDGHRERLRQKFLTHGMDVLQDHEVLELLLFYAVPRRDTNALARSLLKQFGSLSAVLEASAADLCTVAGIGEHAATLLQMVRPLARRYQVSRADKGICLTTTRACGEFLLPYFFGATEEQIYLLCLDAKCKVLACRLLHSGSVNSASVPLRKAAEIALGCGAASVVMAHNHTCDVAVPSKSDIETTEAVKATLAALDVFLADHIIVGSSDFLSMAESGYL
jgi:DNA repair protein RadC